MKGEFEKRMKDAQQTTPVLVAYPYDEKIQTAVFYNTLKIDRMIDEARKDFPRNIKGKSLVEELKHWKNVNLVGQSREVASWIRARIKTLEWILKWFGDEK